jgi:4-carboxymuconolactone decarboxylase
MMSRLKPLKPEEMNAEQLKYHELIMARPIFRNLAKSSPLEGPYNAWIRSPDLMQSLLPYAQYVREGGVLDARLVELAIITVGRVWSAEFEFAAHAVYAVRAGIDSEIVESISRNEVPGFEKDDEVAVYRFAKELTSMCRVEDETYQAAMEQIGEQGLVELIALMGFYVMVCMTLNAFEVPIMEGMKKPFAGEAEV